MSNQEKKPREQVVDDYEFKKELWKRQYYDKFHGLNDDSGHAQVSDAYADPSYMAKLDDERRNGICNLL